MSKVHFIERFQERLLWLAIRGLILDTDERATGPLKAGAYALQAPTKIQTLLSDMYDTLTEKTSDERSSRSPVPSLNGQAPRPGVAGHEPNRGNPGRTQ